MNQTPTPSLFKEHLRLQTGLNLLSTDEATRLIFKQNNFYEFGHRTSSLLPQQARQMAATSFITKIRSQAGETLTDHDGIYKAFPQIYSYIYIYSI